jgi:hypothetical protein
MVKTRKQAFVIWFLIGVATIGIFQFARAAGTGGMGGLLYVGGDHPLAELIRAQIPDTPIAYGTRGHDGQFYFAIGLDPTGIWIPEYIEIADQSAGYRYRRVGYPALSSAFGTLTGRPLLWSMTLLSTLAAGVTAGTVALLAFQSSLTPWYALAVVVNPGVWLSGILLTADNLALAAGFLAIWAYLSARFRLTLLSLAMAVLFKETSILFVVGIAGHALKSRRYRLAAWLSVGPLVPMLFWLAFVQARMGESLASMGTVGLPFAGLVSAIHELAAQTRLDQLWALISLLTIPIAIYAAWRGGTIWRWLTVPWIVVAILSSEEVWEVGNNPIRALTPLLILTALTLADRRHKLEPIQRA